jgi:alkylation response protein AidB-like acyl-CoA dehydrogenase
MTQATGPTTGERDQLLEVARELAVEQLGPRSASIDEGDASALAESWRRVAQVGLDRAIVPEAKGSACLVADDLLAAIEELAFGDGGIAMSVLLSNASMLCVRPEQMPQVEDGGRWAFVPVRPGSELKVNEGRLDGRVESAIGACGAARLVLALSGPEPTSFVIDAGADGVLVDRDEAQMGLRGAPAASVTLKGVDGSVTGGVPGPALALLNAGTAAIARGISRRAFELALEYAKTRTQGGVAIIDHDAVGDMLSAMTVRLGCPLPRFGGIAVALGAKIAATDGAVATTQDAVQVFGGTGYMHDTGVEKLMRDAKYCQLFPEPNWIAQRELLGLEPWTRR